VHAHRLWIDSEYLFDATVRDYLKSIADRIAELGNVRTVLVDTRNQDERVQLATKEANVWRWLMAQHDSRVSVFTKYLQLP
jgi:hypothetical protein